MRIEIQLINCLWLMLPLLVWNIFLGPKIKDTHITSDSFSPKWLLVAENILRLMVFALPLLMPLQINDKTSVTGLWLYILGTLIYFTSWLPILFAPLSTWSNSSAGLLAPRLTPFLVFLGVALIGDSWPYGVISVLFITLHTLHGIQNFQYSQR